LANLNRTGTKQDDVDAEDGMVEEGGEEKVKKRKEKRGGGGGVETIESNLGMSSCHVNIQVVSI
jgi:hypothetical protein